MSWKDRVRETIQFTSPNGDFFEALWIGNEYTREKLVPQFQYPLVDGTFTQDNGLKSAIYPLEFFFEGPDHDLETDRFDLAMRQRGPWVVVHPVRGELNLQPISYSPRLAPVEDANTTKISSEWIEYVDESEFESDVELSGQVRAVSDEVSAQADQRLEESLKDRTGAVAESRNVISNSVGRLRKLSRKVANINAQFESINRGLASTLEQPVIDALSLAGGLRNFITLPSLTTDDARIRFETYAGLIQDLFNDVTPLQTLEAATRAAVLDFSATAITQALAEVSLTSEFETRAQALEAAKTHSDLYDTIVENLDLLQKQFENNPASIKYFSLLLSYAGVTLMTMQAIKYLLQASWNLAVEKRIILDRARPAIEVVISEYGSLGESDVFLDLFIRTNDLSPDDIYLIPEGREVVVYIQAES